jgi:hypothetical protein
MEVELLSIHWHTFPSSSKTIKKGALANLPAILEEISLPSDGIAVTILLASLNT